MLDRHGAEWNKTQGMMDRLGIKSLDKYRFKGLPIIHSNSAVIGGVSLGEGQREAIVVNVDSPALDELYRRARKASRFLWSNFKKWNEIDKGSILESVYDTVKNAFPIQSDKAVERLVEEYKAGKDGVMSLDIFIDEGIGNCRHEGLACTAILELFKKDQLLRGLPRFNRNSTWLGGHGWCSYEHYSYLTTKSDDHITILDVAQGYRGALSKAPAKKSWPYKRPEVF